MNALGNSKQKRLSSRQREAVEKVYRNAYKKDILKAEQNTQFFMTIITLKTLDDYYGFGEKRRSDFMKKMTKVASEIGDFLISNKCYEGDSDIEQYDRDGNIERLKRWAEYYKIPFNEEWCDYYGY